MNPPRYPQIEVCTRSANPLALVAAVRQALRQVHVDREEIRQFSSEALTARDPCRSRQICGHWVNVTAAGGC